MRTAPTLLRSIPLLTLAALFLGMQVPESPADGIAFVITMFGVLLLSCAITNILTISLMWTISGDGITGFAPAVIMTLSGMIVPIPFFPEWL
jgi:ABC-2 type transport system permease protein